MTSQTQSPGGLSTSRPFLAYLAIVVLLIALSLTSSFVRFAQGEGAQSQFIVLCRFGIASLVLFPFMLRRGYFNMLRDISLGHLRFVCLAGFFLAFELVLWTVSLEFTTILISTTLLNTNMLWAAIFETTLLKERVSLAVIIGMLTTLSASAYLIIAGEAVTLNASRPVLGNLLAAVSAVGLAGYMVVGRKQRGTTPLLLYVWLVYTAAAFFSILTMIVTRTPVLGYQPSAYFWAFMVALAAQVFGHSSINYAVRHFTATYVGVAQQLIPVFSALLAFWWFSEQPTAPQIIASLVVLAGVLIATLGPRRRIAAESKSPVPTK